MKKQPSDNLDKKYGEMFEGANPIVFELAKELRRNMTKAELKLWFHLKQGISGFKFRRQHPLKSYIADFYCHKLKLVIEADGGIHNKPDVKEYDAIREQNLTEWGYVVVRFTNEEILKEEEKVIRRIVVIVDELKKKDEYLVEIKLMHKAKSPPAGGFRGLHYEKKRFHQSHFSWHSCIVGIS